MVFTTNPGSFPTYSLSSFKMVRTDSTAIIPCLVLITQQTFVLMKTYWRRLEDVFRLRLQKYVRLSLTSSEDVFKTNTFVLAIRLQDFFKTFLRHLQDVFKTSCKNVLKTSSRHLAKTSSRRLQKVFKTS